MRSRLLCLVCAIAVSLPAPGRARSVSHPVAAETSGRWSLDVEVDPVAYAFRGYSLHAGVGWDRFRLDLGLFAMSLPELLQSNEGFDTSFDGGGVKVQAFLDEDQVGGFVGLGAGVLREEVRHDETDGVIHSWRPSVGVHAGWRFDLVAGLYATPWIGLDYVFGGRSMEVGADRYEPGRWSVFPAVHLGFRFQ